jgi:hypothetical protein
MDPKKGPVKISQQEVARQMVAAQMLRTQSPVTGSSDDDDPSGSEWIWSQTKGCTRKNKHFRAPATTVDPKVEAKVQPTTESAPAAKYPPRPSTPIESTPKVGTVVVPQDSALTLTKGKAPARAKTGAGKKAATKPAVSEATQPMTTRSKSKEASRAGGLRSVGGSGQTDTCVAKGNPSKT